ncbi:HD family phosphohydrolase [Gordonia polyisoprenivorans]|uniref:HD family phosphohydrolase n=1 Tax=Gordonia polyisoprenivorans TaxID=84595 RepID=UPI0022342E80|nr:HD family phosphohydrolase [uncultured Gordonia sp.]UZF55230.1 HD family phosphohydrolase [Gordonia polyisoprenivorans]
MLAGMTSPAEIVTEVTALLDSLHGVYDELAVDEFEHATQAAWQARVDGADDELVLAAALHDIGHSPLIDDHAHHDRAACAWLAPRFGDRVAWLAGAHVAAKRHLAATEPGYAESLSDISVDSLEHQGGAGDVGIEWTGHRWWSDALRLRRFDDAAKVPGAQAISVEELCRIAGSVAERAVATQEALGARDS